MAARYVVRLGYETREVEVEESPDGLRVRINGTWHEARLDQVGQTALFALLIDNHPHELFAEERSGGFDIIIGRDRYSVAVGGRDRPPPPAPETDSTLEEHPAGGWVVLSPMTGVVSQVARKVGDAVSEGDVLMTIEAMKMNNELRAKKAGTVQELYISDGQRVDLGMPLLLLR